VNVSLQISFANQQSVLSVDQPRLEAAIRSILDDSAFTSASISVAIVDDPTIHDLNRRFLQHDWPTDVLSFVLEASQQHLDGELVMSAETALRQATSYGWSGAEELLLYVIHGTLHLVGYQDKQTAEIQAMRAAEEKYLLLQNVRQPSRPDGVPTS